MFISRLISSIFMLSFVGLTIFVFPNLFVGLVAIAMITMGTFEFYSMIEKKGIHPYKYFGILMAVAIPLSIYQEFQLTKGWELLFITAACMVLFMMQLARRGSDQAVLSVSTTIFGILYVSWLFSFVVKLKHLPQGAALVAFLVFVTKASDMGAYAAGSVFGRRTLIQRISPKKTWEGAIGGFLAAILVAYLCRRFMPQLGTVQVLWLGAFLAIVAEMGDLYESLLKRDCLVKDASGLFPGLGGMLDVIDSILFTAPVFYFYVRFFL